MAEISLEDCYIIAGQAPHPYIRGTMPTMAIAHINSPQERYEYIAITEKQVSLFFTEAEANSHMQRLCRKFVDMHELAIVQIKSLFDSALIAAHKGTPAQQLLS